MSWGRILQIAYKGFRTAQNQPAERPRPPGQAHARAGLERLASLLAPASVIDRIGTRQPKPWKWHLGDAGAGVVIRITEVARDHNRDRIPAAHSAEVETENCPSRPGKLVTFQITGKPRVMPSNNSHFTGEALAWAVPPTKSCGLQGEFWRRDVFFKMKIKCKQSDPRHFIRLPKVAH